MSTFFDTNIVVYAFLDNTKTEKAADIVSKGGIISTQVLNEFTNVALKKFKRPWDEIESAISELKEACPEITPLTTETHALAVEIAKLHRTSVYDALIIAAAIDAECEILFSEDLQDGRKFGDLLVVNPFSSQLRGF